MATQKQAELLLRIQEQRSFRSGSPLTDEQKDRLLGKLIRMDHASISALITQYSTEYVPALSPRQEAVLHGLNAQAAAADAGWRAEWNVLTTVAQADRLIKDGIAAVAAARRGTLVTS